MCVQAVNEYFHEKIKVNTLIFSWYVSFHTEIDPNVSLPLVNGSFQNESYTKQKGIKTELHHIIKLYF